MLAAFILSDLFIVALAVWDRLDLGRIHPVSLWMGGLIVLSQPLHLALSETAAWQTFAGWLLGGPG